MKKVFVVVSILMLSVAVCAQTADDVSEAIELVDADGGDGVYIEIAVGNSATESEFNTFNLIAHWALQEVQIPQDQEYEADAGLRNMDQLEFLYGVVNEIGRDTVSWKFSVYDHILTFSRGGLYKNYEILRLTKQELILATDQTLYGRMIYRFVPVENRTLPVIKAKHEGIRFDNMNPRVNRLSNGEISQNITPSAVAYNFVMSIVNKDFKHMLSYLDEDWRKRVVDATDEEWEAEFSKPGKLNILSWLPALSQGYEVAVVYVQNEGYTEYGRKCLKVYVYCVLSSEIGKKGFQEITRYENRTNVKVLVAEDAGTWKVIGFK